MDGPDLPTHVGRVEHVVEMLIVVRASGVGLDLADGGV